MVLISSFLCLLQYFLTTLSKCKYSTTTPYGPFSTSRARVAMILTSLLIFKVSATFIIAPTPLAELRERSSTHHIGIGLNVGRTLEVGGEWIRGVRRKLANWIGYKVQCYSDLIDAMDDIREVIIVVQNYAVELLSSRPDIVVQFSLLLTTYERGEVVCDGFLYCDGHILFHIIFNFPV